MELHFVITTLWTRLWFRRAPLIGLQWSRGSAGGIWDSKLCLLQSISLSPRADGLTLEAKSKISSLVLTVLLRPRKTNSRIFQGEARRCNLNRIRLSVLREASYNTEWNLARWGNQWTESIFRLPFNYRRNETQHRCAERENIVFFTSNKKCISLTLTYLVLML